MTTLQGMSETPRIPDDPEQCRQLLLELLSRGDALPRQAELEQNLVAKERELGELRRVLDATAADHERLQGELAEARETVALLRRWIFSQRRERHIDDDPDQGHLFDLEAPAVTPDAIIEPTVAQAPAPAAPTDRSKPSRRVSLDHLPQHRIEHDLPEADKTCACCGGAKCRIGEDVSRELEYVPPKLEVLVHVRPKYACSKCRDGVASPPVPPKPVPRGIAGPGLVSYVLVSKFADHLTLYRLEDILFRHGLSIARDADQPARGSLLGA
jgi:transposase